MEFSDNNGVILKACRVIQSVEENTEEASSEPEKEQQDRQHEEHVQPEPNQETPDQQPEQDVQPEPNQETPEVKRGPQSLAIVEFRIQQLQNRRFLLQKMQNFTKKAEPSILSETSEDSDELCELDAVQKELEELQVIKEELQKEEGTSNHTENRGHLEDSDVYKCESPRGGIYMLPPLQGHQQGRTEEPAAEEETLSEPIVPVESLGQLPAPTRCTSCGEVIVTETKRVVGEAVWIVSGLCCMLGCVAGCCLIPFFLNRLRNIRHQCPKCHTHIYTFRPF